MRYKVYTLPLLVALLPNTSVAAVVTQVLEAGDTRLRVEIVDVADPARVRMLQRWVAETAEATKRQSGPFSLHDAYVQVREIDSDDASPVPWGQTRRQQEVGVLLYVRRDATYAQLRADWTAVHEFTHLFHPYLGESGRWLAEGLASYYQNVTRARMGILPPEHAWERWDTGFRRGQAAETGTRLDAMGRARGGTMRVYWAGAAFWLEADLALRRSGPHTTLDTVLDHYAGCCLRGTDTVPPVDFITTLDRIAGTDVLLPLYRRYAASQAFPPLGDAYARLGLRREGSRLHFLASPAHAALRRAIMAPLKRSAAPGSSPNRPSDHRRP